MSVYKFALLSLTLGAVGAAQTNAGEIQPPTEPASSEAVSLSNWTYHSTAGRYAFGIDFPGDSSAMGTKLPDDGADGSGNDLELSLGDLVDNDPSDWRNNKQESIQSWVSPTGMIPFEEGVTYRLSYSIRESQPASAEVVEARVKWGYGPAGRMGGGNTVARPQVNPPMTDGTTYSVVFDAFDIASADNPNFYFNEIGNENDMTLSFDAIDIYQNYQGAVELESVMIDKMDASTMVANQTLLAEVTDFLNDTTSSVLDFVSENPTVIRSANSAVLTTPVYQQPDYSWPLLIYGNHEVNLAISELIFKIDELPATSGLIYRTEFDVELENSPSDPLPMMVMRVGTTENAIPRDTSVTNVNSIRQDNSINPAYTTDSTYASYHHFPDDYVADGISGSTYAYGEGLWNTIGLQDQSNFMGGSITVTGIRVYTVPETIFD